MADQVYGLSASIIITTKLVGGLVGNRIKKFKGESLLTYSNWNLADNFSVAFATVLQHIKASQCQEDFSSGLRQ